MDAVFAGWFSQNGNGEMTGTTWVKESGLLYGPVMITNTHSVGVVRDAVIGWAVKHYEFDKSDWWSLPVVAETWDGWLNDINGFHVKPGNAYAALDGARGGPVAEGNVGGGTGMICYEFKGGIGSASRLVKDEAGNYTVGVLVQANFGRRGELLVAGVPVGSEIPEEPAYAALPRPTDRDLGSIIVVVATDAPLLPHQLERIARRATMGIARTGAVAGNGSGDIFIAFSNANPGAADSGPAGAHHVAERSHHAAILGHRAGDRRGNRQCADRGADHRGICGSPCDRTLARSPARGAREVQPPATVSARRAVGQAHLRDIAAHRHRWSHMKRADLA